MVGHCHSKDSHYFCLGVGFPTTHQQDTYVPRFYYIVTVHSNVSTVTFTFISTYSCTDCIVTTHSCACTVTFKHTCRYYIVTMDRWRISTLSLSVWCTTLTLLSIDIFKGYCLVVLGQFVLKWPISRQLKQGPSCLDLKPLWLGTTGLAELKPSCEDCPVAAGYPHHL